MPLRIFVAHPSGLLTDHRPHGDGLVAHGFIAGLAARGHVLHVAVQDVDLRRPLPANVHLHRLGGGGGGAGRLRFMWRLRCLFARLEPTVAFDVVHQLNPVEVGLTLGLVGSRVPLVLGPYVPDWPGRGPGADGEVPAAVAAVKRLVRRAEQGRASMVLLSTPAAGGKLSGARTLVREVPMGIDEEVWSASPPDPAAHDVLFLANLHRRKGIHVMLDAFTRVAAAVPAARLVVAGAGPEEDAVRRRLRDERGLAAATLVGRLDRAGTLAAMGACSVYCLPSYGEPFGMTALEAMARARPVVATDAGGLRHLVPEAGGRVVPQGDAGALAGALTELLGSPALRAGMGRHNRQLVEQRYGWRRVLDRLEAAYDEALDGAGAAARASKASA